MVLWVGREITRGHRSIEANLPEGRPALFKKLLLRVRYIAHFKHCKQQDVFKFYLNLLRNPFRSLQSKGETAFCLEPPICTINSIAFFFWLSAAFPSRGRRIWTRNQQKSRTFSLMRGERLHHHHHKKHSNFKKFRRIDPVIRVYRMNFLILGGCWLLT